MADKEFYSFEEALKELRLKEEELKRLVSEGEIRAFREGETMKLRKADVESLRQELSGGEVVELGGTTEELVFEDDTELDAGMKTEEISEADTMLDQDVEPVEEVAIEEAQPVAEEPAEAEAEEEEEPIAVAAVPDEGVPEGMLVRTVVLLTTLVLLLTTPVIASLATGAQTDIAVGIARLFGAMK